MKNFELDDASLSLSLSIDSLVLPAFSLHLICASPSQFWLETISTLPPLQVYPWYALDVCDSAPKASQIDICTCAEELTSLIYDSMKNLFHA